MLVLPTAASKRLKVLSSGLIYLNDFAALIKAALRADPMLHARLLTVRTSDRLGGAQRIVRAALATACFGMASFWIWHNYSELLNLESVESEIF